MRYIFVSLITIYAPFIQSETLKKTDQYCACKVEY